MDWHEKLQRQVAWPKHSALSYLSASSAKGVLMPVCNLVSVVFHPITENPMHISE